MCCAMPGGTIFSEPPRETLTNSDDAPGPLYHVLKGELLHTYATLPCPHVPPGAPFSRGEIYGINTYIVTYIRTRAHRCGRFHTRADAHNSRPLRARRGNRRRNQNPIVPAEVIRKIFCTHRAGACAQCVVYTRRRCNNIISSYFYLFIYYYYYF